MVAVAAGWLTSDLLMTPYVKSALAAGFLGGIIAIALEVADTLYNDFIDVFACAALIGCGVLAVRHFTKAQNRPVTGGEGVGMGALAGACGGLLTAIGVIVIIALDLGSSQSQLAEASAMTSLEGPAEAAVKAVLNHIEVVLLIALTGIGSVLGLVGGAIGWFFWRRPSAAQ